MKKEKRIIRLLFLVFSFRMCTSRRSIFIPLLLFDPADPLVVPATYESRNLRNEWIKLEFKNSKKFSRHSTLWSYKYAIVTNNNYEYSINRIIISKQTPQNWNLYYFTPVLQDWKVIAHNNNNNIKNGTLRSTFGLANGGVLVCTVVSR